VILASIAGPAKANTRRVVTTEESVKLSVRAAR
jgi:hypothetical protein